MLALVEAMLLSSFSPVLFETLTFRSALDIHGGILRLYGLMSEAVQTTPSLRSWGNKWSVEGSSTLIQTHTIS